MEGFKKDLASMTNDFTDIGHGVRVRVCSYKGIEVGIEERHARQDDPSKPCCGFVWFDVPTEARCPGSPTWTVVSRSPLTLSPSILCRACGHHGFIRNGAWIPA